MPEAATPSIVRGQLVTPLLAFVVGAGVLLCTGSGRSVITSNFANIQALHLLATHRAPVALCTCHTVERRLDERIPAAASPRNQGTAWLLLGDAGRAEKAFTIAARSPEGDEVGALRLSQLAAARGDAATAARWLGGLPQASAFHLADVGLRELTRSHLKEADACLDVAIAVDPRSTAALYGKGRVLLRHGLYREGFALLDRAATLCPECPEVFLNRGFARQLLGEPADAIEADFRHALELKPHDFDNLYVWAAWMQQRGRYQEAEQALKDLNAHYPDRSDARRALAEFRARRASAKEKAE